MPRADASPSGVIFTHILEGAFVSFWNFRDADFFCGPWGILNLPILQWLPEMWVKGTPTGEDKGASAWSGRERVA